MRAMVLEGRCDPLQLREREPPRPEPGQILVQVACCAVCRTDLHVIDGELSGGTLPVVPGHQVVGVVTSGGERFRAKERVGVAWLGWACQKCAYCLSGRENLCDQARFTGHSQDGGYADYLVADERYCFRIPESFNDREAAPLFCAGLIGYRSLVMTEGAQALGFYGFGASAPLIVQVALFQGRRVYAFTRAGDNLGQDFARKMGAVWVGASGEAPPEPLEAAIIFAPVGDLVPIALKAVKKGGIVVCAGIHMSDIPSFPYELLWGERTVRSVANLTRADGEAFLPLAAQVPVRTEVEVFPLEEANRAIAAVRSGRVRGSAVLQT